MNRIAILAVCCLGLAACREDAAADRPDAVAMTDAALGHYCQMNLAEHPGPKGQIHLEGNPAPIFFSQVRDAIAYQRMPEQSHAIAAIYVNDMAVASGWDRPGTENWISADTAFYVVGSSAVGGMGAPELVPFSDPDAAAAFAERNGGRVAGLAEIPDAEVLGPATGDADHAAPEDFRDRLRALSEDGRG